MGNHCYKKSESIIIIYQEYYSNRAEDDSRSLGTGQAGKIQIQPRPVKKSDFSMAYMVLAVTNNSELNEEIYRICKEEGIYVNVASDKNLCDFYFPGICLKDDIVVGITASGVNHKKAKAVREKMQALLEELEKDEDSYE